VYVSCDIVLLHLLLYIQISAAVHFNIRRYVGYSVAPLLIRTIITSFTFPLSCPSSLYFDVHFIFHNLIQNSKLCENTPPFGRRVSTQFLVFPISTPVDITVYQHGKCFIFVKYMLVCEGNG
jgi:hypothetical protein